MKKLIYHNPWNNLSMAEKAEMIGVAVRNGITSLPEIRAKYNEFAEGGRADIIYQHTEPDANLYGGGGYMEKAKAMIRANEGWRSKPYKDAPKGKNWRSVGYGFNDSGFWERYPEGISKHYENGITKAQAEKELDYFLGKAERQLKGIYGKRWNSFNDDQKAAILDTYYQRPASVGSKSGFYGAVMSGKDGAPYLGVQGFGDRNQSRRDLYRGRGVSAPLTFETIAEPVSTEPEIISFKPLNPQAFDNPMFTYTPPTLIEEPVQVNPLVEAYSPEELERQEKRDNLEKFNMFMNMLSSPSDEDTTGLTGMLGAMSMLNGNKKAEGGNIFDRDTEPTQQMQTGRDYWTQLANRPTWLDTFIAPVNGGQLSEVVVKPTDDESWLFSLGRYARNSRKPLADSHSRKVVANYLSRFDNESAKDYNARISRLADTLDIRGVQFIKNNVESGKLKNRAHYDSKSNTAYIDDMQDIFAEIAHPWQDAMGNNSMDDEFKKGNYDPDIDSRGGTRYAYPDTFEGETHGFFQPAITEWVETGKIGRSLPLLNEDLSNEKIVPKDNMEVLDSAASWNKQAIDRRLLANPHQLPLTKRIQYSFWDYPLLKKKALGGHLYDGTSEDSQQTQQGYIRQRPEGSYFYDVQGQPAIDVTPLNMSLSDNPADWTFTDASGKIYNPHRETVKGTGKLSEAVREGPLVSAANNYFRELNWRMQNDPSSIALKGKYTMPLVFSPLLGQGAATALANPYVDAALTSGFGAHGLNHAINEGINGWGDAAMTALELAPLGQLAKPVWNTAANIGTALYNDMYIPYKISNAINKGVKENAVITAYNRNPATKDIGNLWDYQSYLDQVFPNTKVKDVLWHGSRSKNLETFDTNMIGSNTPIKNSVGMYLSPNRYVGESYGRRGGAVYPILLNTENPLVHHQIWGLPKNGINVAKISPKVRNTLLKDYDAVIAPERGEIAFFNPNDALILGSDADVAGFREFVGNTPKGLKPGEPLIARGTPEITAENAASITPEQWTAAQDAAIARGDVAEAQRLRDLHQSLTPTATSGKYYRGTKIKRNSYPDRHIDEEVGEMNGIYLTKKPKYAKTYGDVEEFYLRSNNPLETEGSWTGIIDDATRAEIENAGYDAVVNNRFDTGFLNKLLRNSRDETITFNGKNLKSADAVTFDDNGVRIPLGERDNFNINDIRYGLLPLGIGLTGYGFNE